jgi:cytoskeletal protein RodZ
MADYIETDETTAEVYYGPFWPLLIVIVAIIGWIGYQDWAVNQQRSALDQQFDSAKQAIGQAQGAKSKFIAVAQDLAQVSTKDTNAAAILRDENIRINPASDTNAAPTAPEPPK